MEASNYMMNSTEYGADGIKSATMAKLEVGFPGDLFDQIDDLLDFSNDEIGGPIEDDIGGNFEANSSNCCSKVEFLESKPVLETLSSSSLPIDKAHDSSSVELCVPCDDLAELEWLSNFVEDSFMQNETKPLFPPDFIEVNQQENYESQGAEKFRSASPTSVLEGSSCSGKVFPMFNPEQPVPGKARSKRKARAPADNWASRIFSHAPLQDNSQSSSSSVMIDMEEFAPRPPPMMTTMTTAWQDDSEAPPKKLIKPSHGERRRFHDSNNPLQVRKCLHCGIQKTPQWRAGPMGPKTLCNACGVRYKSGRLLPEYRPAASPTFSILKHSNSHKKVLEMRRQREVTVMRHQVASKVEPNYDDYLLNISTDYRHDALRENIYHSMH